MKNILVIFSLILSCAIASAAQDKSFFSSTDGGFSIELPKDDVVVAPTTDSEGGLGHGQRYSWLKMEDRVFIVTYYDMDEGKVVDAKMRDAIFGGFKDGFIKNAKKNKRRIVEKPYSYGKYKGAEFRMSTAKAVSITRCFMTTTRFYLVQATIKGIDKRIEAAAVKQLATFDLVEVPVLAN